MVFQNFCEALEHLLEQDDDASSVPFHVHEKFNRLCNERFPGPGFGQFIAGYLDALHRKDHRAGSSLFHENGFAKIGLWKSQKSCQLRLHIWPEGHFSDSLIHNHRWNLSSYIVHGALTAINYAVENVGPGRTSLTRLYDADSAGVKAVEAIGEKSVLPSASYEIAKGAGHYLTHDIMHRVKKCSPDIAISLMLSGQAQKEYSLVSHLSPGHPPQKRRFLSSPEIAVELEKLASFFPR